MTNGESFGLIPRSLLQGVSFFLEYSQQYSNLSTKIERDEKRAFTLSLVSAVLGGLSSMFGGGGIPETSNDGQAAGGIYAGKGEGAV